LRSRCHSINKFKVVSKIIYHPLAAGLVLALVSAQAAEPPPKLLGANSCASSSCHGGGGVKQNQVLVWSLKDFHSQRPPATLATARSKQIADALAIKDPVADARCTTCHAPLNSVPEILRGENFKVSEGVTCESCHGPAENWLRSHTRQDWTRADRTASGMRDLQNLYVRANTCVACHQNVDADILNAGHPELIFELDGQSVAEPIHWSIEKNGNGAQAWLIGQAVALREMSWQATREASATDAQGFRWRGLLWLLSSASTVDSRFPKCPPLADPLKTEAIQAWSDQFARTTATLDWSSEISRKLLTTVVGDGLRDFMESDKTLSQQVYARRAERLVLALDRLVAALPELKNNAPAQSALNQLFKLAQSAPDFNSKQFATVLEDFSHATWQN
jgi:hypothetical protein